MDGNWTVGQDAVTAVEAESPMLQRAWRVTNVRVSVMYMSPSKDLASDMPNSCKLMQSRHETIRLDREAEWTHAYRRNIPPSSNTRP